MNAIVDKNSPLPDFGVYLAMRMMGEGGLLVINRR
jgi:hypothetical protein